ncbi:peroxisomal sarcosine oxidase-like [Patiria miniata]|uniref:sarcosine oxidasee (formaldehyde-forming) n=1 Tax=Patiria miniata TaxID=46514 RepID=A0A913ZXV3_PATMI|nr:peroxisomal sarcosine oxidase-like [Patiria miniata]
MSDLHEGSKLYDCVVVGAGIEGSSTAYHLAKKGQDTLLLEQFPLGHSRGSSCGHSRITRYAYAQEHFARMMPECFKIWAELENQTNTRLYRKDGLLAFAEPPYKSLDNMQRSLDSINHTYTLLTGPEINQKYPGIEVSDDTRGLIEHDGGVLLADKCLQAMQKQFQHYGGTIHDSEQVLQILPGTTPIIVTNRAHYRCKSVVLTPGPWASKILRPLGLDPPLKPWRLDVCYWKPKKPGTFDDMPAVITYTKGHNTYALPSEEYPGLIKLCDHTEHKVCDPDKRDVPAADRHVNMEKVRSFARQYFPGLEDVPVVVETCMYTFTPDESFFLDTHPNYHNIVIGCGFSGHGFKLAPVVGKVLSELATQTKPSYDLSPFRLGRFPNGPLAKL